MSYIGNVKVGSTTHLVGSTLYGTCNTAAGTAEKAVTCANFDELLTGVTIHVKFDNTNTIANPTLNVNNTGAKAIKRYGTTAPSTSVQTSWYAGAVISFTYDGTYWMMDDWTYTADGSDTSQLRTYYSNPITGGNGIKQYSLFARLADGTYGSFTTNSGTGTKTFDTTNYFDIRKIFYYNGSSNVASGAYLADNTMSLQENLVDARYTFNNITTSSGFTANKPVYLVFNRSTIKNNFYQLKSPYWTHTPESYSLDSVFVLVGYAHDTYRVTLLINNNKFIACNDSSQEGEELVYPLNDYVNVGQKGSKLIGQFATAEGYDVVASGNESHSEGSQTTASGEYSHAEGYLTKAIGAASHSEGGSSIANAYCAHAEGYTSCAMGLRSHAEGYSSTSYGDDSHAEGYKTCAVGSGTHAEGSTTTAYGYDSHSEGYLTYANGCSHAEGQQTTASGAYSHSEGAGTSAGGTSSHAEGVGSTATGNGSHSEGIDTFSANPASHAEGDMSCAVGHAAHAEGKSFSAGEYSHGEGHSTSALGNYSHAEGSATTASGNYSHTEGYNTIARSSYSHAEGCGTIAGSSSQHVEGKYNVEDANDKYAHIIGGGTNASNRKNIFTVSWDGDVTAGRSTGIENSNKLVTGADIYSGGLAPLDYSITEQATGKHWIDGKEIYQLTVDFGYMPTAQHSKTAYLMYNTTTYIPIETVVNYIPMITKGDNFIMNFYSGANSDNTGCMNIYIAKANLQSTQWYITTYAYSDRSSYKLYLTLWYTKTS